MGTLSIGGELRGEQVQTVDWSPAHIAELNRLTDDAGFLWSAFTKVLGAVLFVAVAMEGDEPVSLALSIGPDRSPEQAIAEAREYFETRAYL